MKCLLAIILGIAIYVGNPVASQNCYTCSYSKEAAEFGLPDVCTDANFDAGSPFVFELPCSGQCKAGELELPGADGEVTSTFIRACGDGICDLSSVNGVDAEEILGVTCCDGNLCNGPSGGAGSVAISTAVILSATAVSGLLVMIF